MKMELTSVHFVLAASGFLLLASGSCAAPMVCHFDSRGEARSSQHLIWPEQNRKHIFGPKSVCGFSTLCLRWEELLTGRQLDGQRLSAVYLSASHRRRLLWDVSTRTTSILLWRFFLHENIRTKVHWKHFFTLLTAQGAPACGFSCVVSGVGGAGYLQSVPGPDSGPPSALLPRWKHPRPQPWNTSATTAGPGVELPLWHPSPHENKVH